MGMIMDSITEWLKEILVGGIISNLSGMFDSVNQQVGDIAVQVGATPQAWNGTIYNMIRNLSDNVIIPIAGVILAFVMTLELIQMVPTAVAIPSQGIQLTVNRDVKVRHTRNFIGCSFASVRPKPALIWLINRF